jgi:hypothetical protein
MSEADENAQVLTASDVVRISAGFDAADALEIYVLQRRAVLHGFAFPIGKSALGIRSRKNTKKLEVTLEYGPLRLGEGSEESAPNIVHQDGVNASSSYATWDNEARIYYTLAIHPAHYKTATYLASMTGAVLRNLLTTAAAYPSGSRRRYQPFAVYRQGQLALKSSSDVDFVDAIWQHLVDVGVELRPLILPARYEIRLLASDIARVQVPRDVKANAIAAFYTNLYNCLGAIATANYTLYANTNVSSLINTNDDDDDMFSNKTAPRNHPPTLRQRRQETKLDYDFNATVSPAGTIAPSSSTSSPTHSTQVQLPADPLTEIAKDAEQAAHDASDAASAAQDAGNPQAAKAAQAAANAAQKSADSTASQAASVAQTNLLSGDGAVMMATVAQQCFRKRMYGLARHNSTAANAFVYWDGNFFFKVRLTNPYVQVVAVSRGIPQPSHAQLESHQQLQQGDLVDYLLAAFVLAFTLLGLLLLVQQVMGRNLRIVGRLYGFQRRLFHPTQYADGAFDIDGQQGQDVHAFGRSAIPLSMGGRISKTVARNLSRSWLDEDEFGIDDLEQDLELVSPRSRHNSDVGISHGISPNINGIATVTENERDLAMVRGTSTPVPERFFRDPDHVDMPDLRSRSKVAVPVSVGISGSSNADDDFDNDEEIRDYQL